MSKHYKLSYFQWLLMSWAVLTDMDTVGRGVRAAEGRSPPLFLSSLRRAAACSVLGSSFAFSAGVSAPCPVQFSGTDQIAASQTWSSSAFQTLSRSFSRNADAAGIANLADVGVREFLVKDGKQFLRLAIPPGVNGRFESGGAAAELLAAQQNLELVKLRFEQVGFTNPSAWGAALKDCNAASSILKSNRAVLIQGPAAESGKSRELYEEKLLPELDQLADALRLKDIERTLAAQETAATELAQLRLWQLPQKTLPFEISSEYASLPRLQGRATVEIEVESKAGFRPEITEQMEKNLQTKRAATAGSAGAPGKPFPRVTLRLEVDGYHAPLTAGSFVDLVNRKFYDGMPIQTVGELIVQTGKPTNGAAAAARTVPLELFYKGDSAPTYGATSDDDLRATEAQILPFQAYGALGMARENEDVDSATSQFFFLKWNQALVAPGRNTLDGYYTCFGYVTENGEFLRQINAGTDKIVTARVVAGMENLLASGASEKGK